MARIARAFVLVVLSAAAALPAPPATAGGGDTCLFDAPTGIVTVVFPAGANQFRTVSRQEGGNGILYGGNPCSTATVRNTDTIYVITAEGAQYLTIDLSGGPFAPGDTPEGSGASEIEFIVDLGAGTDRLTVMGGGGGDRISFKGNGGARLNADADVDVDLTKVEVRLAYGGAGDDVIQADPATSPIYLYGEGGNDTLVGGGADDYLDGGIGGDELIGGAGGDGLTGDAGNDVLRGGSEPDSLEDGPGTDSADGGSGGDSFYPPADPDGADTYLGGPGDDWISYYGRTVGVHADPDGKADDGSGPEGDRIGADVEDLHGGEGPDELGGNGGQNSIEGGGGADVITGGAGEDFLQGDEGADTLRGGADGDSLVGGLGDDEVFGDDGDDSLYSQEVIDGSDDLHGGSGDDFVSYQGRTAAVWLRIGSANEGEIGESDAIASDIESGAGGSGADTITGDNDVNILQGGGGADTIDGGAGADTVYGGFGGDVITAGDGTDQVYGQDDNDTLHLNDGGSDHADCGPGGSDNASDNDIYDTTLTACELT